MNVIAIVVLIFSILGGHLAFTLALDADYVLPMIVGKLVSGVFALALAFLIYGKFYSEKASAVEAQNA